MGRAGYWEGRAEEALGNMPKAQLQAFAFGAEHQTSFYGLLAAERAGIPMDPALTGTTVYPDWRTAPSRTPRPSRRPPSSTRRARCGWPSGSWRISPKARTRQGVGQLVDFALSLRDPHIALMIAKRAAESGIVVPKGYYPGRRPRRDATRACRWNSRCRSPGGKANSTPRDERRRRARAHAGHARHRAGDGGQARHRFR
jgi:soluble lytic murein transglycosylase